MQPLGTWEVLWYIFLAGFSSAQHDAIPIVETSSGLYRGYSPRPDVHAYLGIPFAAPPLGNLRWKPPQPYTPPNNSTVNDASQPYPGCYQLVFNTALNDKLTGTAESEDCLFISVWKPASLKPTGKRKLAVLLWTYGGAFAQGSSNPNDGVDFVSEQQDVIVVSFNYRLNIFGFPTTPAVERRNLGLLDQRAAIEWAAANIEAFGGDPKRMVMAGQSAGSISTAYYSFAYPNDPIIAGIVTMSGQPETNLRDDGSAWKQAATHTNCRNSTYPNTELECMKALPPRTLKRAVSYSNIIEYGALTGGSPTVDNITVFSPAAYVELGINGSFAKTPMWASHTLNEGDNTTPFNASDPKNPINYTVSALITLAAFHCPTVLATGYRVANSVTVYRSVYSGVFPPLQPYPWMRAYHAADVYLMFGGERYVAWQEVGENVLKAGRYLRDAMSAFVKDPEGGLEGFGWERYNGSGKLKRLSTVKIWSVY